MEIKSKRYECRIHQTDDIFHWLLIGSNKAEHAEICSHKIEPVKIKGKKMIKFSALLATGALMLATVPALAAESDTCTSGACQTAEKSWDTVRDGTKNAAHDTTQWTKKTGKKIGNWSKDKSHDVGQWGKNTGKKIGNWSSNAAKDTGNFFEGKKN